MVDEETVNSAEVKDSSVACLAVEGVEDVEEEEEIKERRKNETIFADDDNDDVSQQVNFSNTLSYELYKLKDPHFKCLIYDKEKLFNKVVHSTSDRLISSKEIPSTSTDESTEELVEVKRKTLKDVRQLYDALASEKRKFLERIYTIKKPIDDPKRWIRKIDSDTQTDAFSCTCSTETLLNEKKKLEYLMGLNTVDEFQTMPLTPDLEEIVYEEHDEDELNAATESMKQAQKYLRIHRIFEFYQFLITHLLSATPDNPIDFLTNLLDKCMIYRGGFAEPPLLYDKKHLDCLFNLMDPMRNGYIELEQYKIGMHTLGVCSYNQNPPSNGDGTINKEYFVDEAYDSLTNLLNDMIRRRWIRQMPKKEMKTPPPSLVTIQEENGE